MLSAVAARKAARAAAQSSGVPSSKPPSPPALSKSPSPSPQPARTSNSTDKPASKRRPRVSANAEPSKNKKAKVAHASAKPRYFDPGDTPDVRSGAIDMVDDSTGRIDVSSDSSDSSGEELELEMNIPPLSGPSSISFTKTKRAWSPSRPMSDSSEDDEPSPSDPTGHLTRSALTKSEPVPLSTFRPVPNCNVYPAPENEYTSGGKACILILQPNETLALVGAYSICVLYGSLTLLGVTLSPSNTKHTVFAPRSSPIPILSWVPSDRQGSCTLPIPPTVRQQANTTAILIEYTDTGVEGLGRICKVFENVFKPPRESDAIPGIDFPRIHIVNHGSKDIHPFVLPSSWEAALASIDEQPDSELSSPPICLVKGPKKSGKSTLARTLLNRLLSRYRRVAFLECDVGQSEFTPGGLVALNLVENYAFGPPFTHPSLPYRAHYIGSTSPRTSPSHYLHSIQSLLETYKLDLQFPASFDDPPHGDERIYDAIPLVVNTMGWNKGLGADLNARIGEFVEASHTFEVDGTEERGWPVPPQSQHIPQFSTILRTNVRRCDKVEAIQTEMTNTYHTATDHRHLNILSYFHARFPEPLTPSSLGPALEQITATSWDTSQPLCARYPYEVDYTKAFDRVYLVGSGYEDVVPSELTRVLNGAIIGLISVGPGSTFSGPIRPMSSDTPSLPYTPGEPPPDPALSMCYGLALIRGIPPSLNSHSPHMHVLTPLPTGLLAQARVLVKGEMELPIWGMLDFREDDTGRVAGVEKNHVPYLQWGKVEGIGGEKRRVRRNLMRRGQM